MKKKRREQPVSDKPGSWLFPECLSQDSLPLTSFFWFHKNCQQPNSVKDFQSWIMKEFFFSLTFSSFSTCISVSSLLHPSPGQQLFFLFCAATCWTSCLRVSQRVTVLIQIKAYLRRTFQGRSSSVVKLCWRRKKTQTSAADRWSCFNQTECFSISSKTPRMFNRLLRLGVNMHPERSDHKWTWCEHHQGHNNRRCHNNRNRTVLLTCLC